MLNRLKISLILAPLAHGVVLGPTGTMLSSALLTWLLERERQRLLTAGIDPTPSSTRS